MVRLKIYDGQDKIREVQLGSEVISVGREPGNDLSLPDASVSRRHAQVEPTGHFYLIRDNGSTNGTFVNEMLVRVRVLSHGDVVRVGKYLIRIDGGRHEEHDSTHVRVAEVGLPPHIMESDAAHTAILRFDGEASITDASRDRLLRLHEIQGAIGHVDTTPALLERALDIILAELHAERGSLLLCEQPRPGCDPEAGRNFIPAAVRSTGAREGDEIVIPEAFLLQSTMRMQGLRSELPDGSGRSCLVVPLGDANALRGVVYVDRGAESPPFHPDDLPFLTAIASALSISLANSQLFAEISEEKDKMQAIFTSLTDGVLVVDRDLNVVEANAAATILLGLKEKSPLGANAFDLFAEFDLSPDPEILRASCLREGAVFHITRSDPTGESPGEVYLAGKIMPYRQRASKAKGGVITLKDRSEMRRMEALKKQFIGNVAHKLRTPLTIVQGSLPLLREGGGEMEQILDEVQRSSLSLCDLVNQFMEFVELEVKSDRFVSMPQATELKSLVTKAVSSLVEEARNKGVHFVEQFGENMPPVMARPEHLLQAFRCIIQNAVKFVGPEGKIIVEAEHLNGCLRVDFSDDGPGIPREEIESVFYVCHQVDKERTGQIPGAGLGLTIARHIIREHGGEIRITSPYRFLDHGTQVSVFLPLSVSSKEEPVPVHASQSGATP
jgi:PAS domain S-box-containing protein